MSDILKERDELLNAVKAPERKKKEPSNLALYAAIVFANVVFCVLDIISGVTVWYMTDFVLYGILTFLAGFGPLLLHEFLFVRAYASETQKRIAVLGAIVALMSIVGIGVTASIINMQGIESIGAQNAEIATLVVLVLIAAFHAVISVLYFYVDEGILAKQRTAQTVARAKFQGEQIKAAREILTLVRMGIEERKSVGTIHGSTAAVDEVLAQLGVDNNNNGIPDILETPRQQSRQQFAYNQETPRQQLQPERQHFSDNGHDKSDPTAPRQQ